MHILRESMILKSVPSVFYLFSIRGFFFFFFDLGNFFFSSVIPVICPSAAKFTEAIK